MKVVARLRYIQHFTITIKSLGITTILSKTLTKENNMQGAFNVEFAVFGATVVNPLRGKAADVRNILQFLLDRGEVDIKISVNPFPDPAPNITTHFAAIVSYGGQRRVFACGEGDTLNFQGRFANAEAEEA